LRHSQRLSDFRRIVTKGVCFLEVEIGGSVSQDVV
jgi:hypothetical protein